MLATTRSCADTVPLGQPDETAASGAFKKPCSSSAPSTALSTMRAYVSPKMESDSLAVRLSSSGRIVE
eukprot:5896200-Prymnesium_polylepis.1